MAAFGASGVQLVQSAAAGDAARRPRPMVAAFVGGFLGLLLAVPITAVLKIILGHLWRTYVLGQPFDETVESWRADDARPGIGPLEDLGAPPDGGVPTEVAAPPPSPSPPEPAGRR
jgi:hypothetical protein